MSKKWRGQYQMIYGSSPDLPLHSPCSQYDTTSLCVVITDDILNDVSDPSVVLLLRTRYSVVFHTLFVANSLRLVPPISGWTARAVDHISFHCTYANSPYPSSTPDTANWAEGKGWTERWFGEANLNGPLLLPQGASATTVTSTRWRSMTRDGVKSDEAEFEKIAINSNIDEIQSSTGLPVYKSHCIRTCFQCNYSVN